MSESIKTDIPSMSNGIACTLEIYHPASVVVSTYVSTKEGEVISVILAEVNKQKSDS